VIDESEVVRYRVFFADAECERLGEVLAEADMVNEEYRCCKDDVYMLPISAPLVSGATRLVIVAMTSQGEAPDAGLLELEDILGMLQDRIQFRFTVRGVDYGALQSTPAVRSRLEMAIKQAVADEAGLGISPAHVETSLAPGSILVEVTIKPPIGVDVADVQYRLGQNPSALSSSLRDSVQDVTGIDQISIGPIAITSLSAPVIVRANPAPAVGAASRSAQPIGLWRSWMRIDSRLMVAVVAFLSCLPVTMSLPTLVELPS
jgi:hypothetical protein